MPVNINNHDNQTKPEKGVVEAVKNIIQSRKIEVTVQDAILAFLILVLGVDYAIRGDVNIFLGLSLLVLSVFDFLRFKLKFLDSKQKDLYLKADGKPKE